MTFDPSVQPDAFVGRKPVSSDELRALRAQIWADGSVTAAEAEKLFEMNRSVEPSAEWTDFFVEAISEFMLSQGEPRGYVTEDEANWLIRQVSNDGRIRTHAELELMVKLLEHAEYAPGSLRRFALGSLEQDILTGDGPTRSGEAAPARIDEAEVALIRRLIFAPAGDGPAKVSAAEAEMLFRLKDATLGKDNCPEWKTLFVQGIANHLMAHQDFVPPSSSDELRLEMPYEPRPFGHILSHLGRELPSRHELHDSLFGENQDQAIARIDQAVATDSEVTPGESDWLKRLYDQDHHHDELEQALLDFLGKDGIHPL